MNKTDITAARKMTTVYCDFLQEARKMSTVSGTLITWNDHIYCKVT